MNSNEFKILHSELISYFQLIENDLKWIYSYMHKGNIYDNYNSLNRMNLGNLINELQTLDNYDKNPYISNNEYNFLRQMKELRNYYCHQVYIDFSYVDNSWNSEEYNNIANRLRRDHDKLWNICNNVEQVKLQARNDFKR